MENGFGVEGDEPDFAPLIAPSNYVYVSRQDNPIDGQFILDLSLPPPPGIVLDTNPKNLSLRSSCGQVTTEIWIRHEQTTPNRVSLDLSSGNGGGVRAIVHGPSFENNFTFPSLHMEIGSNYGDVFLSLPRRFRGPITIRTGDDRIALSPAFEAHTALISDISGVRVYFVGTRPQNGPWGIANNGYNGENVEDLLDEITVDGRFTSTRINWEGEEDVTFLAPNPWLSFCSGAERFFTTGKAG